MPTIEEGAHARNRDEDAAPASIQVHPDAEQLRDAMFWWEISGWKMDYEVVPIIEYPWEVDAASKLRAEALRAELN
jgi:hypothetical protein